MTPLTDRAQVVTALCDVEAYFQQRLGTGGFIPRDEWILHWLHQQKTPAEIYAIAMGTEHEARA